MTDAGDLLRRPLTRRRTLQLAAGAVLAATLAGCGGNGPRAQRSFWIEIADAAQQGDRSLTAEAAGAELDNAPSAAGIEQPSAAVRCDLEGRIRADFAAGRTLLVSGWLLSRTEVLLAVLVAEGDS